MRRRRVVLLVLLVAALAVLVVARRPVLRALGGALVEETPLEAADVAVLAYNSPSAAVTAASAVDAGYAPRVVVFAPPPSVDDRVLERLHIPTRAEHDVAIEVMRRMGVRPSAIALDRSVLTGTNDVVRAITRYARAHGFHRVIVVTYRSHTRRTAILLRHALGRDGRVVVRATSSDPFHPDRWWQDRESAREAVSEGLRWVNSLVLGDLWRARSPVDASTAPGALAAGRAR